MSSAYDSPGAVALAGATDLSAATTRPAATDLARDDLDHEARGRGLRELGVELGLQRRGLRRSAERAADLSSWSSQVADADVIL